MIDLASDGFHHVRARRHRNTTDPARGYYDDAYDFDSVALQVLHRLGADGTLRYATSVHDLATDAVITDAEERADPGAILLLAATFIQGPALQGLWDEVIYLDASQDVALGRGVARDSEALGGTEAALRAYHGRYHAAWRIYVDEVSPHQRASRVIDHTDPAHPRLVRA